MDMILIPGFWLDASSWDEVAPVLEQAGHRVRALTLPGLESKAANRSGLRLRDHVQAVVDAIDEADRPVVLVGHSGGGPIAYAAADARPDRVARVVYVDAGPLGDGGAVMDEPPDAKGEIPLPDWSEFGEDDLRDLDEDLRQAFRARAVPEPARVAYDKQVLTDERRFDVPATIIACEYSSERCGSGSLRSTRTSPSSPPCTTSSTSTYPPATGRSSPSRRSWLRRFWRPSTGNERGDRLIA